MPRRSSTSSSERSLTFAGLRPWGVVWALLFGLAFEMGVARADWFWAWPERSTSGAFHAIERLVQAQRPAPSVVFLGSSRVRDAVVPSVIEAEFGLPTRSVANAALTEGSPLDALALYRRNSDWFRDTRLVVLGVEDWCFFTAKGPNERERRMASFAELVDARAISGGLPAALRDHVSKSVLAVRRATLMLTASDESFAPIEIDAEGRLTWRLNRDAREVSNPDWAVNAYYGDGRESDYRVNAIEELGHLLAADGRRLVILHVPLRPEYDEAVQRTVPAARSEFEHRLAEVAVRAGAAAVIDRVSAHDAGLSSSHYADYGHLAREGSLIYSRWLARRLIELDVTDDLR